MRVARLCCALLLAGFAFAAQAKMVHRPVEWSLDGTRFHSVLVYDADKFMDEMRLSPADWQFVVLGHAVHCFTEIDDDSAGCRYDARAAARSYRLMHDWLDHAFAGTP
ncbi:MAG: hypothetical protein ACYCZD_09550 [Rhodanobacter sp.]